MIDCILCLELLYQTAHWTDYRQSRYIEQHQEKFVELNPVIRKVGTRQYFITTAIGHALITEALPDKWKKPWLAGTIALELNVTRQNKFIGVGVKW